MMNNRSKISVLILTLSFLARISYAANYYVKSSGGTGSGLDDANAWSLAKLNATKLAAGDHVFFKRGDVFFGTYTCNSGGNEGNPIVFDAYGTGPNPVISGLRELKEWTRSSGSIYYTSLDVPSLNLVTMDSAVKGMGRYPDSGYLKYSTHSGNGAISDASVGQLPFDPAGGEVVMRKTRWIMDRHLIRSRSSNTLNYSTSSDYGNNGIYSPIDGNGYFIQNHLGTLSGEGEWYYDKAAKRLYMHFGSGTPAGKVVKASVLLQNLYLNYWANMTFNNLDFEGGNVYGAYVIGTSNITFNHCNIRNQGGNGIWSSYVSKLIIQNSTVTNCLNNGIFVEQDGKNIVVDQVHVTNTGSIAGAAKSGDGAQEGMFIVGNGISITNCSVINSGYIGINFQGNDVLVEHNFVDTFSHIKDDGAGIYTYNPGTTASNRIIRKNIVLNAVGTFAGAEAHYWEPFGKAAGIYLDDRSCNTLVDQNTIAHGNWGGILLHNTRDNQITNNLVYDFAQQLLFAVESASNNRKFTVNGNWFIARTSSQKAVQVNLAVPDDPKLMGVFDDNVYARPVDDNLTFTIARTYSGGGADVNLSLEKWKSAYALDVNSVKSKVITSQESNLRFEYNYSGKEKVTPISDFYSDVATTRYRSNIKIPAYSGVVVVKILNTGLSESIGSGSWTQPSIWSGGYVPGPEDDVRINKGHIINVDQDIFTKKIDVSAGAELHFLGNFKVEKVE